jgi:type IV pilus assembly protein PilV
MRRSPKASRGITLVEVLVAVLILAIGLLGLAGLQTQSLNFNHSAYLRSQATTLAYDIIDRMRANRDVALTGSYDIAFEASGTAGTIAGDDLVEWKATLAALLPDGDGSVERDSGDVVVQVRWVDADGVLLDPAFSVRSRL